MKNSNDTKPSIVLVHGAFADGSSWQKVISLAEKRGFNVTAVQNPLKSLAEDTATTKRVIDAQEGAVILVGHSYGGVVITEAAAGSTKVKALVYVAAFVPDAGESAGGLMEKFPPPPLATALQPDAAGFLYINRTKFHEVFAQDLPEQEASVLGAAQKPLAASVFGEPVKAAAWKTIPAWYAVSKQDRAINPELERFMAKRAQAHITEIDGSHVAFISQPEEIIKIIETAADATTN
jgi:pimeloyl-ACP methyl ester carboxylesterase